MQILNYRIIRQLGMGGMGQVFLAQNVNINQLVAIKSLHPRLASNAALRERFKQEAIMLSSLNHPNIVKFLNYVENEAGVFLIMEYVEGDTLEDFIGKKNGLIVEKRAYPMMCEILDAFSYAHQRGIVHRDIKPSNIFINKEGHIKVMDFGIAQILTDVAGGSGPVMGTPEYMSPEQVYGYTLDQRSDIYSLGVLLHQMLTGRAPYDATTLSELEIKRRVVNETLPRMKEYYPYVSDGIQKVVDKATSKRLDMRYSSCSDMKKAMKKVIDPDPVNRTPFYYAAGIAAVLICVGIGVWDYYRTKVEYYKDYVEYFGVPEGVGELSSREVGHRQMSYRIESSRYKVRRLTLVNSAGKTVTHNDTEHKISRYSDVEYFYTDNGAIDYKKVYDQYGKLLFKLDYDENLKTAIFKHDDEFGTGMYLEANTTDLYKDNSSDKKRSRISRYLLRYNENTGLLEQMLYASGENNERVGDEANVFGWSYEYDSKGRVKKVCFLGADGKPRGNKVGLSIRTYEYDSDDNWISTCYYSADGKPSHDGNNCFKVVLSYDEWGNRASEMYEDENGNPSLRTDCSLYGMVYQYDEHGNEIQRTAVDGNGEMMISKYGWAVMKSEYNEDCFHTEVSYWDMKGNRTTDMSDNEGVSMMRMKPNEVGLSLEIAYYDQNEQLMNKTDGVARVVCEYDSCGNLTKAEYYDKNDKRTLNNGFYASLTRTYDEFSREVSSRTYGIDGKLADGGDGAYGYNYEYNKHGNVTRFTIIGSDGKSPVNCQNGYAYIVFKYDEIGNEISKEFCDANGNNCLTGNGWHKVETVYENATNFVSEEKYYGLSSLLYTNHYSYDAAGNIIKEYKTDAKGKLSNGTQVENSEWNRKNQCTKQWWTDLNGKLTNCPGENYAQALYKYDNRGNIVEFEYLKANGQPGANSQGAYRMIHKFNEANLLVYEKNLGSDGKPLKAGKNNTEAKCTYDGHGNRTSIACYDGYGNPAVGTDGFHKCVMTYNERNQMLTLEYTDTKGKLVNDKSNGFARQVDEYDSKGNRTSRKLYKENGSLDIEERYTYNDRNMIESYLLLNAKGQQDDSRYAFSKIIIEYEKDHVTPAKKKYYNAKGTLLGHQTYNKKTGDWGAIQLTSAVTGATPNVTQAAIGMTGGWRSEWESLKSACPLKLTDGILLKNVSVRDTEVSLYIKLTTFSSSDILDNADGLKQALREFSNEMRSKSSTPKNVTIDIYVYDSSDKFVLIV